MGLLSPFPPFRCFPHIPLLSKQTLAFEYDISIWQVSPQLSCGDICQIWTSFKEYNRYFCNIENFAYGEINERSFSNPTPGMVIIGRDLATTRPNEMVTMCIGRRCTFIGIYFGELAHENTGDKSLWPISHGDLIIIIWCGVHLILEDEQAASNRRRSCAYSSIINAIQI